MVDATAPLVLDLLEWLDARPRLYAEVMEAWRTSCPRLTVWEDALEGRLIQCSLQSTGVGMLVHVTEDGYDLLKQMRPESRSGEIVPSS